MEIKSRRILSLLLATALITQATIPAFAEELGNSQPLPVVENIQENVIATPEVPETPEVLTDTINSEVTPAPKGDDVVKEMNPEGTNEPSDITAEEKRESEEKNETKPEEENTKEECVHSFVYASNGDGTHTMSCTLCEETAIEECEFINGNCDKCGYSDDELVEQTISKIVGTRRISVSGMLPKGATVKVTEISEQSQIVFIEKLVDDKLEAIYPEEDEPEYTASVTYDIAIFDANGNEYQPMNDGNTVTVFFEDVLIEDKESLAVYRINDDLSVDEMNASGEGIIQFETEHFTLYTAGGVEIDESEYLYKSSYEGHCLFVKTDGTMVTTTDSSCPLGEKIKATTETTHLGLNVAIWSDGVCIINGKQTEHSLNSSAPWCNNAIIIYADYNAGNFSQGHMFNSCKATKFITGSNFNTEDVTDMNHMFAFCQLTSLELNFDTANVTNMQGMFYYCSNLTTLELHFNTAKVTDMSKMFYSCSKLKTIYSDSFDLSSKTSGAQMFTGCTSLKSATKSYNSQSVASSEANNFNGYFTECNRKLCEYDGIIYETKNCSSKSYFNVGDPNSPYWYEFSDGFCYVGGNTGGIIYEDTFKYVLRRIKILYLDFQASNDLGRLFHDSSVLYNPSTVEKIICGDNFDISEVSSFDNMFSYNQNLTYVDSKLFEQMNVSISAKNMFYSCKKIETLDLTNMKIKSGAELNNMFYECSSLKTIYSNGFNANTFDGTSMFYGCTALKGAIDYNQSKTDSNYANPCTGYFTRKESPVTGHIDKNNDGVCDDCGAHQHVFANPTSNGDGTHTGVCADDGETETVGCNYGSYVSNNDATCLSDGTKSATCKDCGYIKTVTDEGSVKGHDWGEYTSNNDATCTEDGTKTRVCKNDSSHKETISDIGSKLGHSYTSLITKPATCTEKGMMTFVCENDSSHTYTEDIAATGHTSASANNAVAATCTTAGKQSDTKCSVCGVTLTTGNIVEATGHTPVTANNAVAATCTTPGKNSDTKCSVCGETLTTGSTINATGHNYGTPTYTWSADGKTCTAKRICSNDSNHVDSENATITSTVKIAATCTAKGTTTYTAKFNNRVFSTQTKDLVDIAATGHSSVSVNNGVAATCTTAGKDNDTKCSVCGITLTTGSTINATGHNYGEPIYTWSEDGKTCNAKRVCSNDSNHIETENAAITPSLKNAATCAIKGTTTYTATFTNAAFTTQTKDVQDIAELGHNYSSEFTTDTAATCTTAGSKSQHCTRNGCTSKQNITNIAATGHNYGVPTYTWSADGETCTAERICSNDSNHTETQNGTITSEVKTAATCTTKGSATNTATFTNGAFSKQTKDVDIAAKGHDWGEYTYNNDATYDADGTKTRTCVDCSITDTVAAEGTKLIKTPSNSIVNAGGNIGAFLPSISQPLTPQSDKDTPKDTDTKEESKQQMKPLDKTQPAKNSEGNNVEANADNIGNTEASNNNASQNAANSSPISPIGGLSNIPTKPVISGVIKDDKGNPVENVDVELANKNTGEVVDKTTTNEKGEYNFSKVSAGEYSIEVKKSNGETLQTITAIISDDETPLAHYSNDNGSFTLSTSEIKQTNGFTAGSKSENIFERAANNYPTLMISLLAIGVGGYAAVAFKNRRKEKY